MADFSIFGASGFIGRNLAAELRRSGHQVRAIGREFPSPRESLGHVVYCIGLTANFRDHLADTVRAHVCLLAEVLESYHFESFLQLSSTRVYAGAAETSENSVLQVRPDLPDHLYNVSKLAGEALCLSYQRPSIRVARLSNVIGEGDRAVNFLPSLLAEARRAGKLVIRTSEQSTKDYIDVRDVCTLLPRIALNGGERVYNVASGVNTSNAAIAEAIHPAFGVAVTFADRAPTIVFPQIDIARVRREFGFSPIPFATSFAGLANVPAKV